MSNYPQPLSPSRNATIPYKFKIKQDFTYQTQWALDEPYIAEWLEISVDGLVTVKANQTGFAWDGCTPKWSFFHLFIIGTPDGHIDIRTMKPFTYFASMVHDVLYQYLDTIPIRKADVDLLFLEMLGDFKPRRLYYFAVKYGGGRGIKQLGIKQYGVKNDNKDE